MQATVTLNQTLQQMSIVLSQVGVGTSIGLSWKGFLLCLLFAGLITIACATYIIIYHASKMAMIMALLFLFIGALFIAFFFIRQPQVAVWYGLSPGLSSCNTEFVDSATYTNPNDAANALVLRAKKEKYIIGMDYIRNDPNSDIGTANFYRGTLSEECYQSIKNPSPNMWNHPDLLVDIRNAVYVCGTLDVSQSVPLDSVQGDVFLNCLNGDLFYRLPTNTLLGNPTTSWQKPDSITKQIGSNPNVPPIQMKNNVFQDAITSHASNAKVFFYIPMNTTLIRQNPNDTNKKQVTLVGYSAEEPYGKTTSVSFGTNSFIVNQTNLVPGPNDFFLVPYPYGETSIKSSDPPELQVYMYGSIYYLYRAIANTNNSTKSKVPYVPYNEPLIEATNPINIINRINGRGVIPLIQWRISTCIVTPQRNYRFFWLANSFFIFAIILFCIWMVQEGKSATTSTLSSASSTENNQKQMK
jgi:hypothetical protein